MCTARSIFVDSLFKWKKNKAGKVTSQFRFTRRKSLSSIYSRGLFILLFRYVVLFDFVSSLSVFFALLLYRLYWLQRDGFISYQGVDISTM